MYYDEETGKGEPFGTSPVSDTYIELIYKPPTEEQIKRYRIEKPFLFDENGCWKYDFSQPERLNEEDVYDKGSSENILC